MPKKKKAIVTTKNDVELKPTQAQAPVPAPVPPSPKKEPPKSIPTAEFKEKFRHSMSDMLALTVNALINIRDGCKDPPGVARKALEEMRKAGAYEKAPEAQS